MSGVYGADVAYPTSVAQWQTLMQQNGVTFGIVRCYESVGQVDRAVPSCLAVRTRR